MIRKLRWPILITLLALVVIAALLLGQQPELQPVAPVVEPVTGGVYAEGLIGSMIRLNPLLDYYNPADRDIDRLLFSSLLQFDDRGLPQGDLVDSWGISRDGTVYNFSIRPEAVWHDGEPVTSDDVIFTVERMREVGSPLPEDLRQLWEQVQVKRLDEKTLQFRLPEAYSPFMDYLTFGIVPEHLLSGLTLSEIIDSDFNLQPVGSGPYQFKELIIEDGVIRGVALQAFEGYYKKAPFIEQFNFFYYENAGAALAAYQEGEILGISQVPPEILSAVLQLPELDLHTSRLPQLTMIYLNLDNPKVDFFQQAAIRRALLAGLNRQRMIDRVLGGQALLADGPIFPGTWAYYDHIERVGFDADQAIKLIKESGFSIPASGGSVRENESGVRLSFELLYVAETHQALAESVQEDWSRLGVEVKLVPLAFDEVVSAINERLYQAALVALDLARFPDPDPYPFWHQAQINGGQNYANWNDRQASEYLEQARVTTDLAERTRLYRNFQVRFTQELPALPLFYPVYRYAVNQEIQGVRMGPLFDPSDRFATVVDWFLVTRRASGQQATPTPEATPVE
jgi:peptide/nickel transport system substrate-binding protein